MSIPFGTKYVLDKSEGLDDVLQALGVPDEKRKKINEATGHIILNKDANDVYTMIFNSSLKPEQSFTFKLGEVTDHETIDGRKVKSVFTLDGNVLNEVQTGEDYSGTNKREFNQSEMIQTITLGDKVCKRTFIGQ